MKKMVFVLPGEEIILPYRGYLEKGWIVEKYFLVLDLLPYSQVRLQNMSSESKDISCIQCIYIPGPTGTSTQGQEGVEGEEGPLGPTGLDGFNGVPGSQGEPGVTGPTGFTGSSITYFSDALIDTCDLVPENHLIYVEGGSTLPKNIVLQTKGNGSMWRLDTSTLIGSSRGQGANDFSISRLSCDQVASGNLSLVSGGENQKSEFEGSVVLGGKNNLNQSIYGAIGCGESHILQGSYGWIGSGLINTTKSDRNVIVNGLSNQTQGENTMIGCGSNQSTSSANTVILNGEVNIIDSSSLNAIIINGKVNQLFTSSHSLIGSGESNLMIESNCNVMQNGKNNSIYTGNNNCLGTGEGIGCTGSSNVMVTGKANQLQNISSFNMIITGESNSFSNTNLSSRYLGILSGFSNQVNSTIARNTSTIGTGKTNLCSNNTLQFIANGENNTIAASNSLIFTGKSNSIQSSSTNGIIFSGESNTITSNKARGLIGTGKENQIIVGNNSLVFGGTKNIISGTNACIGSGSNNYSGGTNSPVLGGKTNIINNNTLNCFFGGGEDNSVSINRGVGLICSGQTNRLTANFTIVMGGKSNAANSFFSTVGSGEQNITTASNSIIFSGFSNSLTVSNTANSSIVTGESNTIIFSNCSNSLIGSGKQNNVSSNSQSNSVTLSGLSNTNNLQSFIGSGQNNTLTNNSVIFSGKQNVTSGVSNFHFIGNGESNLIKSGIGFIGNGFSNTLDASSCNVILNGRGNKMTTFSFIGGGSNQQNSTATFTSILNGNNLKLTVYNNSSAMGYFNNDATINLTTAWGFSNNSLTPGINNFGTRNRSFIIGNGVTSSLKNAFCVTDAGHACAEVGFVAGAADFAEWFESDEPIPPFTPVYLDNGLVKKVQATTPMENWFGITSSSPLLIGNQMYSSNVDYLGRLIYEVNGEKGSIVEELILKDQYLFSTNTHTYLSSSPLVTINQQSYTGPFTVVSGTEIYNDEYHWIQTDDPTGTLESFGIYQTYDPTGTLESFGIDQTDDPTGTLESYQESFLFHGKTYILVNELQVKIQSETIDLSTITFIVSQKDPIQYRFTKKDGTILTSFEPFPEMIISPTGSKSLVGLKGQLWVDHSFAPYPSDWLVLKSNGIKVVIQENGLIEQQIIGETCSFQIGRIDPIPNSKTLWYDKILIR